MNRTQVLLVFVAIVIVRGAWELRRTQTIEVGVPDWATTAPSPSSGRASLDADGPLLLASRHTETLAGWQQAPTGDDRQVTNGRIALTSPALSANALADAASVLTAPRHRKRTTDGVTWKATVGQSGDLLVAVRQLDCPEGKRAAMVASVEDTEEALLDVLGDLQCSNKPFVALPHVAALLAVSSSSGWSEWLPTNAFQALFTRAGDTLRVHDRTKLLPLAPQARLAAVRSDLFRFDRYDGAKITRRPNAGFDLYAGTISDGVTTRAVAAGLWQCGDRGVIVEMRTGEKQLASAMATLRTLSCATVATKTFLLDAIGASADEAM